MSRQRAYSKDVTPCQGAFHAIFLYDVAEAIRLADVRDQLAAEPAMRKPGFAMPAPEYVRYEQPPVVESAGTIEAGGESFEARISYFDRGVVSLQLTRPFTGSLDDMKALSSRWVGSPELERQALQCAIARLARIEGAIEKPYQLLLSEDYAVLELNDAQENRIRLSAAELAARHGGTIVCAIRGEQQALSDSEVREVLRSALSYNPGDLVVVGWMAAFVYDTPAAAAPTVQLLEYANAQLLEYRRYDQLLTDVLENGYSALDRGTSLWHYWRLSRQARQLNALRLDVMELTERTDNAIKFLSDMYYARVHQLASEKVGVNDYRRLVDEKLRTAGELYHFMVAEFRETRMLLLEAAIVLILVIDLIFLFRGKT